MRNELVLSRKFIWIVLICASIGLMLGALTKALPLGMTEVLGFVSGAVCVLLVVEQNIWNFPVGIANNVFFILLFLTARLYGDMALQFIYVALGLHGWCQWLYGGANKSVLHVRRTRLREWVLLTTVCVAATAGLTCYLARIKDAAPFLDAFTTALSLIAQYMLNKKRLENWWIWISADVIYIGLYAYKGLFLTSVLYAVFIGMCAAGLRAWTKDMARAGLTPEPLPVQEPI